MNQKKFYNNEANLFAIHKEKYGIVDTIGIKFIDSIMWELKNKIILDYWCGNGKNTIRLAEKWAEFVLGTDISNILLKEALHNIWDYENISFLHIDPKNQLFHKILQHNVFDYILSYYVLCTIKDKDLLNNIGKSIFSSLKPDGSFITLLPNRDNFNGKTCFWFSYIEKLNMKEWDEVITYLRTSDFPLPNIDNDDKNHLKIIDYYWPQETYINILKDIWFKQVEIIELFAEEKSYNWIIDEVNFSPIYVIQAVK